MRLVGQWLFDDDASAGVDTSQFGNNALFQQGATQAGGNAVFDRDGGDTLDDYVEIPNVTDPDDPTQSLYELQSATIDIDFTVNALTGDATGDGDVLSGDLQTIVSRDSRDFDGGGHFTIWVDGDGSIRVRHQTETESYFINTPAGLVTPGQEIRIVYNFGPNENGVDQGMRLFLDDGSGNLSLVGQNTDPVTANDPVSLSGNQEPWTLGASQVTSEDGVANTGDLQNFLDGQVSRFQLFDGIVDDPPIIAICFTLGTMILTPAGERPVETLAVGDLVTTADHGDRPIRWIGRREVPGDGLLTPIRIKAGTLGNVRDLLVSPLHRMLIRDWRADLMFGEAEVLIAARELVDHDRIFAERHEMIEYLHILFDDHEIVFANGAPSESFHPGATSLSAIDMAARDEILTLFPELRDQASQQHRAARAILKRYECRAMNLLVND